MAKRFSGRGVRVGSLVVLRQYPSRAWSMMLRLRELGPASRYGRVAKSSTQIDSLVNTSSAFSSLETSAMICPTSLASSLSDTASSSYAVERLMS
jgi:hypothetical protein